MKTHSEYFKSLNLKITHSDSQKVLYLKKNPVEFTSVSSPGHIPSHSAII